MSKVCDNPSAAAQRMIDEIAAARTDQLADHQQAFAKGYAYALLELRLINLPTWESLIDEIQETRAAWRRRASGQD
ncbi:hypothetical protein [Pseudomonas sp. R5(2019)]|uniref:hypothetical protein n=1 Tax=Pseudomonas sp. R5(2019) TaxID=2697566 RepID=UPI001412C253|nr:hypothetical protein [Pseudomonas sp. R5(2019)]NBA94903.1 hypothetical protein [Pseudomonas sp. R5(2019)]